MLCQVYKSPRRQEMYLYVEKATGLQQVPAALLTRFGTPEEVMLLKLDGSRQLARVDVQQVRQSIQEQGYFLQMPPGAANIGTADIEAARAARD